MAGFAGVLAGFYAGFLDRGRQEWNTVVILSEAKDLCNSPAELALRTSA
jgi:hypothetical protein